MELAPEKTRLFDFYDYQMAHYPQKVALAGKENGGWVTYSTQDVIDRANELSTGLLRLGVKPGDRIGLIANNRPEWVIADRAILQIGAVNVPIYPTVTDEDYAFIFNDAEVRMVFLSDEVILDKVERARKQAPSIEDIFTFDRIEGRKYWKECLAEKPDVTEIDRLRSQVKASDMATLIYTSGTTGTPKGVMLSHHNVASNAIASKERLPVFSGGKGVSFLPLCHIYERMLIYLYTYTGVSLYFAESMDTIGENIKEVQPEVFTAVPRVLEKVFDKIMDKGAELTGLKRKLFFWAVDLGERWEPYGGNGPWYELKLKIARKLIFSKWQAALGGNVKAVASGSAALNPRLARIFNAAGVPVLEGYGLTETSPVISVNQVENRGMRIGTTGRPIRDVHVKIDDDGEILVKGPNVMMGYYKRPDLTAEVIDAQGWLHTGDIGELVDGEFLKITDRKKEIFKTSGGKYIAPQLMENLFKESRFIEQIMVLGENRKHPSALVVPSFEFLEEWCRRKGYACGTHQEMAENPKVIERIGQEIEEINRNFGHWEQVKQYRILAEPFTIENDMITPTLKLRRKEIHRRYGELIDSIYATARK